MPFVVIKLDPAAFILSVYWNQVGVALFAVELY